MSWKNISGARLAGQLLPDIHVMDIGEEGEEIIVIPEGVPEVVPEKAPVKEPVKEPARTGGWKNAQSQYSEGEPEMKPQKTVHGELIGYRHGLVAKRDGQYMLHSPIKPMPWERGPVTATCGNGKDHEAPFKGCTCGLYAKWDESGTAQEFGNHEWITQVKAWGKIQPGTKGFKAQHMQVVGIRPPKCEQCDEPATHMISANENALSGRPTCTDHMPDTISGGKIKVKATPIADVAKELSDYYGGAEVRNHGEDWSNIKGDEDSDDMSEFEKNIQSLGWKTTNGWARVGWVYPNPKG